MPGKEGAQSLDDLGSEFGGWSRRDGEIASVELWVAGVDGC